MYFACPGGVSAKWMPRTAPRRETLWLAWARRSEWPTASRTTSSWNGAANSPRSSGKTRGVNSKASGTLSRRNCMGSPYRAVRKPDGRLGKCSPRRGNRASRVTSAAPRGRARRWCCHNERTAASAAIATPTAPMAVETLRRQAGATALGCRAGGQFHRWSAFHRGPPLAVPGERPVTQTHPVSSVIPAQGTTEKTTGNPMTYPAGGVAPVTDDEIFIGHEGGKLSVAAVRPISDPRDLSIAYTPGVAKVSRAIAEDAAKAKRYTWADRLVVVVSDGTAVLGLGDIGASASLPVMEGKSVLFKTFGGLNSIPLVLDTTDVDEIVETLVRLRPSFGAVNLEDVSAPRCFELEDKLKDALDCPVMHDDQHGTAIILLAAIKGANAVLGRPISDQRIVIAGAGASGVACANILQSAGAGDLTV